MPLCPLWLRVCNQNVNSEVRTSLRPTEQPVMNECNAAVKIISANDRYRAGQFQPFMTGYGRFLPLKSVVYSYIE